MLVENFEPWQLWIIAGMLIISIIIGYAIRLLILSKATLKGFLIAALVILLFVFIGLAINIWPGISYPNLAAGLIGLMVGMIRAKK